MNNADKHIVHWSSADVQKYLDGELSAGEMHDLEQLALDDPFLADALEGLHTPSSQTVQQDLAELRSRLGHRVTARRAPIARHAIPVAAAAILLVGLGFTAFYTLLDKKQPAPIAITPPPAASAAPPAAAPPAPSVVAKATPQALARQYADPSRVSPPLANAKALSIARSTGETKRPQTNADTKLDREGTPAIASTPVIGTTAAVKNAEQPQPASVADIAPVASRIYRDSSFSADIAKDTIEAFGSGFHPRLLAFSGRVLDLNHRPLAGAYLTYKSKGIVTAAVTDAKGQFNLNIPQKDSTRQLTIAMIGYEETKYVLSPDEQTGNTIYLRQDPAQLSEVVVTGYGAKRKEYMAETPSDKPEKLDSLWLHTAPVMGRIAYLDYLGTAAKTLPVDTAIHGTESISFRVDKKGALTEFRIEHSLSPAHDAGVIRLISEGPGWKMLHGRYARALVNVIF